MYALFSHVPQVWEKFGQIICNPKRKSLQIGCNEKGPMLEEMWAEQWAGHFHIVWGCPVIQSYWQEVTQAACKIFADLFVQEKYLLQGYHQLPIRKLEHEKDNRPNLQQSLTVLL